MKKKLGALNCLYPMPVTLVGANVRGKPNYITMAHVGIMTRNVISLGMGKVHYTNAGIKENGTFSVNIPSEEMVKETDYCGIVTGKNTDKAALFDNFYGELKTAPMISACPINMECKLVETVDFPTHDVFVGEIVATYCDEEILTEEMVDHSRVRPMLFDMNSKSYWRLGQRFAKCWNIGKELKKK
jgi:flavin reductase (DIM6/NTAB) family NADH-FMN oxidoreductase RutF